MDDQKNTTPVDLQALLAQANLEKPAAYDADALRQALVADDQIWRRLSDLSRVSREVALSSLPPIQRESILLRAEKMETDLGYHLCTPLERQLIAQVVTSWLHLELAQLMYGETILHLDNGSTTTALDQRLVTAQRRYLNATDAFIRLRMKFLETRNPFLAGALWKPPDPVKTDDDGDEDYYDSDDDSNNDPPNFLHLVPA